MKLNFKALNIAKAERQDERKFFDVFNGMSTGSMGISDLLFLYHAGGASDDDFDKAMYKNFKTCAGFTFFNNDEEETEKTR